MNGSSKHKFADRFRRSRAATAAVEAAFIFPVLIITLFGIVEFGRALFIQGVLAHSLNEAARFAIVNPNATTTQIQTSAEGNFVMIDPSAISAFTTTELLNADQTRLVTISITYPMQLSIPMVALDPIQLSASTQVLRDG